MPVAHRPVPAVPACRLDRAGKSPLFPSPVVTTAPMVAGARSQENVGDSGAEVGQKIEVTMSTERQLGEVRFLTVAEVAAIMRVSKMTVYRMVHAGELPAIRVGRSFRVPEDEVHAYLRSSFVDTA